MVRNRKEKFERKNKDKRWPNWELGKLIGQRDSDMSILSEQQLMNEDGAEVTVPTPGTLGSKRRACVPVQIWAEVKSVHLRSSAKCGGESDKVFYTSEAYTMLFLTNRTIKVTSKRNKENSMYVPLENVGSFQVLRDESFKQRIESSGD